MAETTSTAFSFETVISKVPEESVTVLVCVPLITMEAPLTGLLFSSFIIPFTTVEETVVETENTNAIKHNRMLFIMYDLR